MPDVLAPKRRYPSPVRDSFEQAFPTIARLIHVINRDDHATLIRYLQRLESWLVIEQVCPLLVNRVPIVPLHDAIYCRRGDLTIVRAAFKTVFDKIGFSLSLKEG